MENDGGDGKHTERIGGIVQRTVSSIGEVPLHAPPLLVETTACQRLRITGAISAASLLRGSPGSNVDKLSLSSSSPAVTAKASKVKTRVRMRRGGNDFFSGIP